MQAIINSRVFAIVTTAAFGVTLATALFYSL